ncbi:MAG: hypothetical protein Q8Q46_01835 [Candidatus Giovannonibacteria bacterium]|nr:hypothetical protein [Candidatus Giovannonibacteria bacterium]
MRPWNQKGKYFVSTEDEILAFKRCEKIHPCSHCSRFRPKFPFRFNNIAVRKEQSSQP